MRRDDGTILHTVDEGDPNGPPVVLAHGFLADHTNWDLVRPKLVARGHRVITFDQRGHGESTLGRDGTNARAMAHDYRALLQHFDLRDAVLVGHSMGAYLATRFCIEHPTIVRERLRGIVLIGGNAGDVARGSVQNRMQIPLIRSGVLAHMIAVPPLGRAFVRSLFGEATPDAALLEALRRRFQPTRMKAALDVLSAMVEGDEYPRLGSIDVPTVVVCGEVDRTCPRWHSERLGKGIRGARNVWLPRIGHMVVYEAPDAVVEAIASFDIRARVAAA